MNPEAYNSVFLKILNAIPVEPFSKEEPSTNRSPLCTLWDGGLLPQADMILNGLDKKARKLAHTLVLLVVAVAPSLSIDLERPSERRVSE